MATQQTIVEARAGSVNARVRKAGTDEPLVYLHGAFGYAAWPAFLDRLAERFTVYAPIQPGFSEEPPFNSPLVKGGIEGGLDQIEDILDLTLYHFDLLESLGLESPNVVGHFIGGMIAAEMAALRPASVGKLVLAAPTGLWLDDNPGVDYFATPATELRSILFNDPKSSLATEAMPEPEDDEQRGIMAIDRVRSLSTVGRYLWPIPDKGLKKRLGRVKAETLIVVAENDRIVPPVYGDEFARRIANARVEVIQDAGHMFMLERPDTFARLVTEFLAG